MDMISKINKKVRELKPSGIRKFFDIVQSKEGVISLGVGEPDFRTPWNIVDAAFYSMKKGKTHYTSNYGTPEFREEVRKYLQKYDLDYGIDEIFATIGGSEGIDLALRTLIEPGDEIIVPEPVYVPYEPMSGLAGATVVGINTAKTGLKLTADALEAHITPKTKAVILCYPNNPTGIILEKSEVEAIAKVVMKHKIWVITDEIYSELTFGKEHYSIAAVPGMKEQTIYLNGFSKSYAMTGWRIGYVAGPKALIDIMIKIHQYAAICAPIMAQYGAVEALRNSKNEVDNMREAFSRRRKLIYDSFVNFGFDVCEPEGAMYIFPDISSLGLNGEEFAIRLLEEENVAVVPGIAFGEQFSDYIRCSYATSLDNLRVAIKKIGNFIDRLKDERNYFNK